MVIDDIKKIASGSKVETGAMSFKTDAPLDDRFTVKNKAGLICKEVFGVYENNQWKAKKDWIYQGMSTTVQDTGFTYVLSDISKLTLYSVADINTNVSGSESWLDTEIAKSWTRVATEDDITTLSNTIATNMLLLAGVFQFQGVGTAIDLDFTTVTVTPLQYDSKTFNCTGFNYDLGHQIYYRWESGASVYYTEEGDTTNKLYTISGSLSNVMCVEHNGEIFYADGTVGEGAAERSKFTPLVGNSVYAGSVLSISPAPGSTDFFSSSTTQTNDTKLFSATPIIYAAYTFSPVRADPNDNTSAHLTGTNGTGVPETANSVNKGHVYQIGEKEYASNGLIWVELGSPKQENNWIVL